MTNGSGRTRRRALTALASLPVATLMAGKVISAVAPKTRTGHCRSQAGFAAYRAAYDDAIATMPVPTRTHDVRTEAGSVRVYEWAADDDAAGGALPVVLVPGIRSGVPMWAENLPHWIGSCDDARVRFGCRVGRPAS